MFGFLLVMLVLAVLTFGLGLFLIRRDRGAKEPPAALLGAVGFGVLAVIVAITLNHTLLPISLEEVLEFDEEVTPNLLLMLISGLMIGIIEETVKIIPLAFFIFRKKYFNEHTDGVMYFALCGLCFGFIEDFFYILEGGAAVGWLRIIIIPYFHAATAGVFGFYLARYKITGKSKQAVVGAFLGVILLHGLYDFGLFSQIDELIVFSLILTALVNTALFLYYFEAVKLDQKLGLSSGGNNDFCRSCGVKNANKTLYCVSCGAHT